MIEQFMVLANVYVAERIYRAFPTCALLRRHPLPRADGMEAFERFAATLGVRVDTSRCGVAFIRHVCAWQSLILCMSMELVLVFSIGVLVSHSPASALLSPASLICRFVFTVPRSCAFSGAAIARWPRRWPRSRRAPRRTR